LKSAAENGCFARASESMNHQWDKVLL
jgi:hypothetical protein